MIGGRRTSRRGRTWMISSVPGPGELFAVTLGGRTVATAIPWELALMQVRRSRKAADKVLVEERDGYRTRLTRGI